jgi:hypothetical protein
MRCEPKNYLVVPDINATKIHESLMPAEISIGAKLRYDLMLRHGQSGELLSIVVTKFFKHTRPPKA